VVCFGEHPIEAKFDQAGLESGFDDPKALLLLVYKQGRWSAWRQLLPD